MIMHEVVGPMVVVEYFSCGLVAQEFDSSIRCFGAYLFFILKLYPLAISCFLSFSFINCSSVFEPYCSPFDVLFLSLIENLCELRDIVQMLRMSLYTVLNFKW